MLLNGTEHCGNHTSCSNSNDDIYGFSCLCQAGYVSHRINYGQDLSVGVVLVLVFRLQGQGRVYRGRAQLWGQH